MKYRCLGHSGLTVSAIGLGCMSMSGMYGEIDEAEAIAVIHRAPELGLNLLDTSDFYGFGRNEELVGRALKGRRDRYVLCSKFGNLRRADGSADVNGRPDYVVEACNKSLKRLGVEVIDLYYQHRVDDKVPIEDTVGAMACLVEQGKVRYLGLSEAAAGTIRRAHAVHPIAAVQTEYSLWSRDAETAWLPTCRELGIAYVAYSPLGRGFLTGTVTEATLPFNDRRRSQPRFMSANLVQNERLLIALRAAAKATDATPAQVALAWLLTRGEDIVSLPSSDRIAYLEANSAAADITLDRATVESLEAAFSPGAATGTRLPVESLERVNL